MNLRQYKLPITGEWTIFSPNCVEDRFMKKDTIFNLAENEWLVFRPIDMCIGPMSSNPRLYEVTLLKRKLPKNFKSAQTGTNV